MNTASPTFIELDTKGNSGSGVLPPHLQDNVYLHSVDKVENALLVRGYDFNKGIDYHTIFSQTYAHTGF